VQHRLRAHRVLTRVARAYSRRVRANEREGELICCTRAPSSSRYPSRSLFLGPLRSLTRYPPSPPACSLSHSISFQFPFSLSLFSIHPSVQIPRPESATGLNATHLTNPSTQLLFLCLFLSLSLSLFSLSSFFFYPICFISRSNGALSVSLNLSLFA